MGGITVQTIEILYLYRGVQVEHDFLLGVFHTMFVPIEFDS
jgi:hypothetical protein